VIRGWFRKRRGSADDEAVLRLESELQQARLEIQERNRAIERLRSEAASARERADAEAERLAEARIERLVSSMAVPLTQFATQAHLHGTGTADIQVGSVIEVGTRLLRVLSGVGVESVGSIGATEAFDPDRHDPLSDAPAPEPGRPVVVRMVGLSLHGKVLRKAGIETGGGS
jgi:molecular chaperone GrpE (heat shock protein)